MESMTYLIVYRTMEGNMLFENINFGPSDFQKTKGARKQGVTKVSRFESKQHKCGWVYNPSKSSNSHSFLRN